MSSWKTERPKLHCKEVAPEEELPPPIIEDMSSAQEQPATEMPHLEEQQKETGPKGNLSSEDKQRAQRDNLNKILLSLLAKIPGKNGKAQFELSFAA
eukprot:gi/632988226/ref/XP_007882991.1/ PREDICTED: histone-lysine N-methyltransferase ASH1L-like [Callorhinchus milii]